MMSNFSQGACAFLNKRLPGVQQPAGDVLSRSWDVNHPRSLEGIRWLITVDNDIANISQLKCQQLVYHADDHDISHQLLGERFQVSSWQRHISMSTRKLVLWWRTARRPPRHHKPPQLIGLIQQENECDTTSHCGCCLIHGSTVHPNHWLFVLLLSLHMSKDLTPEKMLW